MATHPVLLSTSLQFFQYSNIMIKSKGIGSLRFDGAKRNRTATCAMRKHRSTIEPWPLDVFWTPKGISKDRV